VDKESDIICKKRETKEMKKFKCIGLKALVLMGVIFTGTVYSQISENKLSLQEEKAGYDLLFNGTDLNNWHAYRTNAVTNAWTVKSDGKLGARIENQSGDKLPILTNKKYQNFDLKINWQCPENGNSGIFIRYLEVAATANNKRSGPEAQVVGPKHSDGQNQNHTPGAAYDMFPVPDSLRHQWTNVSGTWNEFRIIAYDSNIVHYGNGIKLLEYKIGTPEYMVAYNKSKYAGDGNNGMYYDLHEGSFLLQHHGEIGITYRNIKAKKLSVHPFLQEFPKGKWPDILAQSYVLGKRGCTVASSPNYDSTAEVGDGSCVSSVYQKEMVNLKVGLEKRGGQFLIKLPMKYSKVNLYKINGSKIEIQKMGRLNYVVNEEQITSGLYFLTVRVGRQRFSKLLVFRKN